LGGIGRQPVLKADAAKRAGDAMNEDSLYREEIEQLYQTHPSRVGFLFR
jgi:hypothetical protein